MKPLGVFKDDDCTERGAEKYGAFDASEAVQKELSRLKLRCT